MDRLRQDDDELKTQAAEQAALIAGTRLHARVLRKNLERMRGEVESLNSDMEVLINEAESRSLEENSIVETPEPPPPPEDSVSLQSMEEQSNNRRIVTRALIDFIWATSCVAHAVTLSVSAFGFPVARAFLTIPKSPFAMTDSESVFPFLYALPAGLTFIMLYTVLALIMSTFEAVCHTCAVAGLLHAQKVASVDKFEESDGNKNMPKTIEVLIGQISRFKADE